jgi:hypothetical protein
MPHSRRVSAIPVDKRSGGAIMDANRTHPPRCTPSTDWIYLGNSPRTKLAPPPLDVDLTRLDTLCLRRLADRMG